MHGHQDALQRLLYAATFLCHIVLRFVEAQVHALLEQSAGSFTGVNNQVLQDAINDLSQLIGQSQTLQLTSISEARTLLREWLSV